jgi:DNA integrity scanning protein DisA with diadenylate cyclase activity
MDGSAKRWRDLHVADRSSSPHPRKEKEGGSQDQDGRASMKPLRFTDRFKTLYNLAIRLSESAEADAVLLLLEGPADWARLKNLAGEEKVIVAADSPRELEGAKEAGLETVVLDMPESPVYDRLTQAILEAVADDIIAPGSSVVAVYSGFEADVMDSVSVINLGEHLDRLTGRDLRQLETRVPLDTLKIVVDLAVEIGREGREGKPVGTMFVVGDTRKVLAHSRPVSFDPVRGYSRKERNLTDPRVREGIKEIAQLDGAILVRNDGTVEAACRYVDAPAPAKPLTLSKGLGARHWAAASISRATKAVAITVSQSNGTVRLWQNGEVVLRIEPLHRRPMVWKEFDYEPPPPESRPKGKPDGGKPPAG